MLLKIYLKGRTAPLLVKFSLSLYFTTVGTTDKRQKVVCTRQKQKATAQDSSTARWTYWSWSTSAHLETKRSSDNQPKWINMIWETLALQFKTLHLPPQTCWSPTTLWHPKVCSTVRLTTPSYWMKRKEDWWWEPKTTFSPSTSSTSARISYR